MPSAFLANECLVYVFLEPIYPVSNCCVILGWASGGRPICTLSLLFLSNTDSPFSMIGADAVLTVQLNGSGRAVICMTLPDFDEEEVDL